jgi:hypothetical protein
MKGRLFFVLCVPSLFLLTACCVWRLAVSRWTNAVALGDLDGDGDLDAYLANGESEGGAPDTVWLNDGSGTFPDSVRQEFIVETRSVSLGDLDGDGDLDALVGVAGSAMVVLNDGTAGFTFQPKPLMVLSSGAYSLHPVLGDLDRDGDLDVVLGACCGASISPPDFPPGPVNVLRSFNMIWLNDGHGEFKVTNQRLGVLGTLGVALGDLDGDGDLDIVDANTRSLTEGTGEPARDQPNMVWLNDGSGKFADSGQRLGEVESRAVALGDLDGDGDLDALVGNRGLDAVWLNDGNAQFSDSGQTLGESDTRLVVLDDLDADGDLDAFCAGPGFGAVMLNQGGTQGGAQGTLECSQRLKLSTRAAAAIGDVDGDGDQDVFAGLLETTPRVWLNDGAGKFVRAR